MMVLGCIHQLGGSMKAANNKMSVFGQFFLCILHKKGMSVY